MHVAGAGPARCGHHHVVESAMRMNGQARHQRVAGRPGVARIGVARRGPGVDEGETGNRTGGQASGAPVLVGLRHAVEVPGEDRGQRLPSLGLTPEHLGEMVHQSRQLGAAAGGLFEPVLEVGAGGDEWTTIVSGPLHPGHQYVAPGRLALLVGQRAESLDGERPAGQHRVDHPVGGLGVAVEPGEVCGGDGVQTQLLAEAGGLGGAVGFDPGFLKGEHIRGGPLDP